MSYPYTGRWTFSKWPDWRRERAFLWTHWSPRRSPHLEPALCSRKWYQGWSNHRAGQSDTGKTVRHRLDRPFSVSATQQQNLFVNVSVHKRQFTQLLVKYLWAALKPEIRMPKAPRSRKEKNPKTSGVLLLWIFSNTVVHLADADARLEGDFKTLVKTNLWGKIHLQKAIGCRFQMRTSTKLGLILMYFSTASTSEHIIKHHLYKWVEKPFDHNARAVFNYKRNYSVKPL